LKKSFYKRILLSYRRGCCFKLYIAYLASTWKKYGLQSSLNRGIKGPKNYRDLLWKIIDVWNMMYNPQALEYLLMYDKGRYLYSVKCQWISMDPFKKPIQYWYIVNFIDLVYSTILAFSDYRMTHKSIHVLLNILTALCDLVLNFKPHGLNYRKCQSNENLPFWWNLPSREN